ncbi:MAG TPA: nucleotide sugar dehydrogenase [Acidobacteriaceae bacterium]|jgi:UDP-N-acetyl-D-glucosamine dehydrogenase|nr:nucleotide sugar dehydrogenase [Acidobacteriaceae bacterium]
MNPAQLTKATAPAAWQHRLEKRELQIGIIGLGYVGLPLALLFSTERFRVVGFDIDSNKVDKLNAGQSYIYRIEPEHIQAAQKNGLRATSDFSEIATVDAVLICVPTPLSEHRTPDMSYIVSTMEKIAPHLRSGQLLVLESTTYPGTTAEIVVPAIENAGNVKAVREPGQAGVYVAFSPEREDPGNTRVARRDIPKVVGGLDATATEMAAGLYNSIFDRVVRVSSPAAAEMTKLLENIYRCVNIALVNELKLLCLRMGLDIWEIIDAAATKPFGFQPFYPGPGLGGHCIPIDPFYLSWKAKEYDFATRFIELAGEVNEAMPYHVIQSVMHALNRERKPLRGSRVLVLGVAYKRDVDDLRESPALTIIETLQREGAEVSYNDPFFARVGNGRHYHLNMTSTPLDRIPEFDCVLIVTDHTAYDYKRIVTEAQLVVDSRNATRGIDSPKIVRC